MSKFNDSLKKLLENKNLEIHEAEGAMFEIMSGSVSEIKLASWLTALKMKGESPEEISGCASAMLQHANKIEVNDENAVDIVGTGGDGAHTINISTASAIVASAAGLTVAKHGNRAVSSKSGSADILTALGVNININPTAMTNCLNEIGLAFLFAPTLHPAMKYAVPVRKELGVRTIFNILGPICNPANIKNAVIGVFSPMLCRQIAEAARNLGFKRLMVVHGNDGLDEITTTTSTKICELKNNEILEYELYPREFGIDYSNIDDIKGEGPEKNAEILRGIFSGKYTGPKKDIIVLNSAAVLLVAGVTSDWKEAIKITDAVISSGKAMKKLESLIKFTNNLHETSK
jgi:anthranilate phosphoribosyltransferase